MLQLAAAILVALWDKVVGGGVHCVCTIEAQVFVYSILIDQIGLGEPSGRRRGCGVPSGFSSFFSPKANGQWLPEQSMRQVR